MIIDISIAHITIILCKQDSPPVVMTARGILQIFHGVHMVGFVYMGSLYNGVCTEGRVPATLNATFNSMRGLALRTRVTS